MIDKKTLKEISFMAEWWIDLCHRMEKLLIEDKHFVVSGG